MKTNIEDTKLQKEKQNIRALLTLLKGHYKEFTISEKSLAPQETSLLNKYYPEVLSTHSLDVFAYVTSDSEKEKEQLINRLHEEKFHEFFELEDTLNEIKINSSNKEYKKILAYLDDVCEFLFLKTIPYKKEDGLSDVVTMQELVTSKYYTKNSSIDACMFSALKSMKGDVNQLFRSFGMRPPLIDLKKGQEGDLWYIGHLKRQANKKQCSFLEFVEKEWENENQTLGILLTNLGEEFYQNLANNFSPHHHAQYYESNGIKLIPGFLAQLQRLAYRGDLDKTVLVATLLEYPEFRKAVLDYNIEPSDSKREQILQNYAFGWGFQPKRTLKEMLPNYEFGELLPNDNDVISEIDNAKGSVKARIQVISNRYGIVEADLYKAYDDCNLEAVARLFEESIDDFNTQHNQSADTQKGLSSGASGIYESVHDYESDYFSVGDGGVNYADVNQVIKKVDRASKKFQSLNSSPTDPIDLSDSPSPNFMHFDFDEVLFSAAELNNEENDEKSNFVLDKPLRLDNRVKEKTEVVKPMDKEQAKSMECIKSQIQRMYKDKASEIWDYKYNKDQLVKIPTPANCFFELIAKLLIRNSIEDRASELAEELGIDGSSLQAAIKDQNAVKSQCK